MTEFQSHYDGQPEGAYRRKVDRADLKKIFYKNETTFKFDKYVTKLKGFFNVLERYGVPLYEEHMDEHLLENIISPNTELKIEVNIFRSSHLSRFFRTPTYLSTVVARLYPYVNPSPGCFRNIIMYATGPGDRDRGRGENFDSRGRVR